MSTTPVPTHRLAPALALVLLLIPCRTWALDRVDAGLVGGVVRSLDGQTRRFGGIGEIRARVEGCENGFLCAANASFLGGYGVAGSGGFQQWMTLDVGFRFEPIALYWTFGASGLVAGYRGEDFEMGYFAPMVGSGVRFRNDDFTIVAEVHAAYLWRFVGEHVPIASMQIGVLLPFDADRDRS
jgi:hypothetical protein